MKGSGAIFLKLHACRSESKTCERNKKGGPKTAFSVNPVNWKSYSAAVSAAFAASSAALASAASAAAFSAARACAAATFSASRRAFSSAAAWRSDSFSLRARVPVF